MIYLINEEKKRGRERERRQRGGERGRERVRERENDFQAILYGGDTASISGKLRRT